MISTKKHIQVLAALLHARGIYNIIISPGSRSGPLVHTLAGCGLFKCRSIVDERSAGYFATGVAQAVRKPVAIVCSSGTAALNFAPAVAEAFYQNLPLVVLTADRPPYQINQGENQTLQQDNIYRDFCKREITLPMEETEELLWYSARLINETLNLAVAGLPGPVHINIPLEEPLHDLLNLPLPEVKMIVQTPTVQTPTEMQWDKLADRFNRAKKVMILPGQQEPNPILKKILAELSKKTKSLVLREQFANLNYKIFVENGDLLLSYLKSNPDEHFHPDLIISFGGSIVSRPLKQFLRQCKPENHWHINPSAQYHDTYHSLTEVIESEPTDFFRQLTQRVSEKKQEYGQLWKKLEKKIKKRRDSYIRQVAFCDLKAVSQVGKHLPENTLLHLGNSAPVRYALLLDTINKTEYYGNRGVSGIDGSLSTAVGFSACSEKINTVLLGDLSFFYDSNALWNKHIKENLRVIVLHNGGGNIFSMINGPSESPAFRSFFFTDNDARAEGLARAFGLDYIGADSEETLDEGLKQLYAPGRQRATLLEVFTNAEVNTTHYRGLFKFIKTGKL